MHHRSRTSIASFKWSVALIACCLVTGCYTYSVMGLPANARAYSAIPGVPFYIRKAACRQETVYREEILRVRLVIERLTFDSAGKVTARDTTFDREKLVPQDTMNQNALHALKDVIRSHPRSDSLVMDAFTNLGVYDPSSNWSAGGKAVMIANQMSPSTYVDYSTTYYMNSQRPLVGSATNTFKLNQDGTLGEGSATIDDKSLETIGGLIPIQDILSGLGAPTPAITAETARAGGRTLPPWKFQYNLTMESAPILHTLARTTPLNDAQTCAQQRQLTRADSLTTEYVRKPGSEPEAPPPPKGNNITISGQLTLPPKP
jgi:hypothetical protein